MPIPVKHCAKWIMHSAFVLTASVSYAQPFTQWNFDHNADSEGWVAPREVGGAVMGGSLWLTLAPREQDPSKLSSIRFQVFGDTDLDSSTDSPIDIQSPEALNVSPSKTTQLQVRLRVLNLSPVSDVVLRWRSKEQPWSVKDKLGRLPQSRRCALKPDLKAWQTVTCHIDKDWSGLIDQIGLRISHRIRGDLWIDSIEVADGAPEPRVQRADIASARVVPQLTLPGVSQAGFAAAFQALDRNMITRVPMTGFTHPFISPGGYYGEGGWWEWDSSTAVMAVQWTNPAFAEGILRGFMDVQALNPDGRIDLYGHAAIRGQVGDQSMLPVYFERAFEVARRTSDAALRVDLYRSMKSYLDWWLSPVKRDARTGLISATFEESFGDRSMGPHLISEKPALGMLPLTLAPMDTNVAVAVGAALTAELAGALGQQEDAFRYRRVFRELSEAINAYLWDEEQGAYYNYDLRKQEKRAGLIVTTFDPLRLKIAPADRRERLLKRLLDPSQFNWGKLPLTSWAMNQPGYVEAEGNYDGRAWFGNVWAARNATVIAGLQESGRHDLAAELNWATIKAFHEKYYEFLLPSTGKGQGAENFTITPAQYIAGIVARLFGVDVDTIRKQVRIAPHIPEELYGKDIALENLILPAGADTRLSVFINQSAPTVATIRATLTGALPQGDLVIDLPGSGKERRVTMRRSLSVEFK